MSDPTYDPASPVPGVSLQGYADEVSVPAGGSVRFMVSGSPGEAAVELVRLIHGDPNPAGPGYRDEQVDWGQPARVRVIEQPIAFGSYIEIANAQALNPDGAFTLALWFCPTLLSRNWHTLAAKWARDNLAYALFCAGAGILTAAVSKDGRSAEWCTAKEPVQLRRWQFAAFSYEPLTGEMCLHQWTPGEADPLRASTTFAAKSEPDSGVLAAAKQVSAGPIYRGNAPLLFGACPDPRADSAGRWAHFNGKLGHPVLLQGALDEAAVWALARGADPASLAPVLGRWHLGHQVSGRRVADLSAYENHGIAVNAPGRAVTGPHWQGFPANLYTERPDDYDAVHLHEDDLDDAGWQAAFEVTIPKEARSGIYAARLERGHDQLFLPLVVRPLTPKADLGVLIPTLTWQAYGSNRMPYSYTEDGVVDSGLCLYNVHSDGSLVYYTTRRRPTRSWNPCAGFQHWGAHTITANLYFIDWLEAKGFRYDVFSDEDLHRDGQALLEQFRCIVLGSHPEYCTSAMLRGLRGYLREGGRIVYLAGNGLYWVTSLDPERPHLIEVRKEGEGDYTSLFVNEPGQSQHSSTLEIGGLWARRGQPPRSLLGVEHAANVYTDGTGRWGFRRLPASYDPRYAFVFSSVESDEVIGDFGLNLGSAAGFEMDAVQDWLWSEETGKPVVLARAAHELFFPPRRPPVAPAAEIALTTLPAGGAVFAAGSVTWTGSLSHNGYANNVSAVTENVLRRFLDAAAGESVLERVG